MSKYSKISIFFILISPVLNAFSIDYAKYRPCWDENYQATELELKTAESSLNKENGGPDSEYFRALCFKKLGEYLKMVDVISGLVDSDPNYHFAYQQRGFAFHMLGRYEEAIMDFQFSIENMLGDKKDYFLISRSYSALKKYTEAEKYLLEGIERGQSQVSATGDVKVVRYMEVDMYQELINILSIQKRFDDIQSIMISALEKTPGSFELFEMTAGFFKAQKMDDALVELVNRFCKNSYIKSSKYCS